MPPPKPSSHPTSIPFSALKVGLLLGRGQFGSVFKGEWDGKDVAIKRVHIQDDYDYKTYFAREVEVLNLVRHPHCLKFLGISTGESGNDLYIITEFVQGGNLRDYLQKKKPLWPDRCRIAVEMAKALDYLHRNHIIHRDVKTENVLMTVEGGVKLCDFGFSRADNTDESKRMTFLGSEWFEAPEIMFCTDYDERIDIFSFGMVLCELLSGKSPSMSNFKRVIPGFGLDKDEIRAKALEGAPAEFVNMAIQCTEAEADHRPTLVDAITYLKDAYKEAANEELVDVKDEGEVLIQQFDDLVIELPTTPTKEETPEPPSPAAAPPSLQVLKDTVSTKDTKALLVKSALVAMAQLQLMGESPVNDPQWVFFLKEFRWKIKVRDIQVMGTLRRIKTYRACFTGSEAVDWLVREKQVMRDEAVKVGNALVRLNVVRSVSDSAKTVSKSRFHTSLFQDLPTALYRFSENGLFFRDDNKLSTKAAGSPSVKK